MRISGYSIRAYLRQEFQSNVQIVRKTRTVATRDVCMIASGLVRGCRAGHRGEGIVGAEVCYIESCYVITTADYGVIIVRRRRCP